MWEKINKDKKDRYKKIISNFASLSEAFTQKASDDNKNIVPIVNSKFQETIFQSVFNAVGEDIANTSYDASLILNQEDKYLVGIKSFGYRSGAQKIAQFKKDSQKDLWGEIISEITYNSKSANSIEEANKANEYLYLKLAKKIAKLRNMRIASSKAQIKGFNANDDSVNSVYHVLMPNVNNDKTEIIVGETDYTPIEINEIVIEGATSLSKPTNFNFTDGRHKYRYTSADSQLLMHFNNENIILDRWEISYVDNPISVFENLSDSINNINKSDYESTVSWMLYNKNGDVEQYSGFNGFNGAPKSSKQNNDREHKIQNIKNKYINCLSSSNLEFIINSLEIILLKDYIKKEQKMKRDQYRKKLMSYLSNLNNNQLIKDVESMIFRPTYEMYIPIPDSKSFHQKNPDFFGENIGKLNGKKLALAKKDRCFQLEFMSSGNTITAYINQENGKSIQSIDKQDILGRWILGEVFQLKPREVLTGDKLNELGINAIRLVKFKEPSRGIGLEFIWIDQDNPPSDSIGWLSKL